MKPLVLIFLVASLVGNSQYGFEFNVPPNFNSYKNPKLEKKLIQDCPNSSIYMYKSEDGHSEFYIHLYKESYNHVFDTIDQMLLCMGESLVSQNKTEVRVNGLDFKGLLYFTDTIYNADFITQYRGKIIHYNYKTSSIWDKINLDKVMTTFVIHDSTIMPDAIFPYGANKVSFYNRWRTEEKLFVSVIILSVLAYLMYKFPYRFIDFLFYDILFWRHKSDKDVKGTFKPLIYTLIGICMIMIFSILIWIIFLIVKDGLN